MKKKLHNILYRIFNADGALLYIGATTDPAVRFHDHARTQPWWDEASNITLERFDTLDELNHAELVAIQREEPRHNVIGLKPHVWARKPRSRKGGGTIFQRADGYWVGGFEAPPINGKRRQKRVLARTREEVEAKVAKLRAEVSA